MSPVNKDSFISSSSVSILFVSFILLHELELPVWCWKGVVMEFLLWLIRIRTQCCLCVAWLSGGSGIVIKLWHSLQMQLRCGIAMAVAWVAAAAPTQPLSQELSCAAGAALKRNKLIKKLKAMSVWDLEYWGKIPSAGTMATAYSHSEFTAILRC